MPVFTITSNDDHILTDNNYQSNVRFNEKSTVVITKNPDPATVVFGTFDSAGLFVAFKDGIITEDDVINHGKGAVLVAQVSSLTTSLEIMVN